MADSDRSRIIPDGWIFKPKSRRGSNASHYFCPATGQIFSTYKALMHYVEYARKAKVSIYAPDFDAGKSTGKRRGRPQTKNKICEPPTGGKVPSKRTKATLAALKQFPSDVDQITVPKSGISGNYPPKSCEETGQPDSKEASPATGQTKVPGKRTEAGSAALKQLPLDVGQDTAPKSGIGGEFPLKGLKDACLPDSKEVSPAVAHTKVPGKRTEAGSAALKQLPLDVGQNMVPKSGIGGEFPLKGWKDACLPDSKEVSPAVGETKVPGKRTEAGSAALKQLPPDVGQNKVPKSGIGGEFPLKGLKEACLPDSKEVSPAAGQTKVPGKRTEAGSAALKQLPLHVGQNKVPKFGIGGEFPLKGWKEAYLAYVEEGFPAVDHTKVRRKRTEAGSAALKRLPSAVGQIKVPKFGISDNIPRKRRKGACLPDAKELSPAINETKIPTVAMRAELPPERRKEASLPDLKQLSPGDDHSKDLKSASGVEFPPKRLREGYLQHSPAVDQTSIWSTSTREKIPPRRKNYCPPAIKQLSLGQSSKLGAINEGEVNIGLMDMTPMADYGGVQEYTPLEGSSGETNYDWAFEANIFPFQAGSEAGEEPTISALDRSLQNFMEPSRPYIELQYQRREKNKSTRPTVGQLRKKET